MIDNLAYLSDVFGIRALELVVRRDDTTVKR
jgi:hypothetical protein